MDNNRLTFLFHRYVKGIASVNERKELRQLLSDAANEPQVKLLLEDLWNSVPEGKLPTEKSEGILQSILSAEKIQPSSRPLLLLMKIAAALLITVLSLGAIYYFIRLDPWSDYALQPDSQSQPAARFLNLPDGSTVILNEGSKLDYPPSLAGNIREVFLSGEAYFDIASDPSRPFIVHTGKLKTTVLGTAFNIRAYPDQKNITVTVRRGRVQLSDEQKVIGIIHPNQQIIFDTRQGSAATATVDTEVVTKWMEKDIFFDDITFGQAIDQLERRFDISITVENAPLLECRFTATFMKGEDLRQILTILCEFNNATLEENGSGGFVIQGGECPS